MHILQLWSCIHPAAFGSEQELVLALPGNLFLRLGNERRRQGDDSRFAVFGRYEPHPAFSAIGPCAADAGFAVSEVETLNLQGERFV